MLIAVIIVIAIIGFWVFNSSQTQKLEVKKSVEVDLDEIAEHSWSDGDSYHTFNFSKMTYTHSYETSDYRHTSHYILDKKEDGWYMYLTFSKCFSPVLVEVKDGKITPEFLAKYPKENLKYEHEIGGAEKQIAGVKIEKPALLIEQFNIYSEKKAAILRRVG